MYQAGTAKREITAFKKNVGMMGYGMAHNTVEDIETPLYTRAFVFQHGPTGNKLAYVVNEQCFITVALRKEILKRLHRDHPELDLHEANVFLTSQHTHSGPGGYSHYGLYNISIPGFVREVFSSIVEGTVAAIVEAAQNLQPARLSFSKGDFAPDVPVAFNRSMKAYRRNPETQDHPIEDDHLAVDRTMRLLRIDHLDGQPMAQINWFGVHTTSVHNDNHSICSDNKGYASSYMEEEIAPSNPDFLAAFAQGCAGDVTPNYVMDKKKKWTRGKFENDFESARFNGKLQYELARELFEQAPGDHVVAGGIDTTVRNFDFSQVTCDPDFTQGKTGQMTGPACHGVAFFAGTKEGPGMPAPITATAKFLSSFIKYWELSTNVFRKPERRAYHKAKYRIQKPKHILFESGERKVLGSWDIKNLIIPAFADKNIRYLKKLHPKGKREKHPWTPHVLPLQIARLGDLVLVGIPAEVTTVAGIRLRKLVKAEFDRAGIHEVIIHPYANAYCGYITTNEEYQAQCYEGGHTVFGQWTLAAFQTKLRTLIRDMVAEQRGKAVQHEAHSPEFKSEEIQRRSYAENL